VALLDLQYHDVNRSRGVFYLLQAKGRVDRIVTDEAVTKAMDSPPQRPGPGFGASSSNGRRNSAAISPSTGSPEAERPDSANGLLKDRSAHTTSASSGSSSRFRLLSGDRRA